MVAETILEIQGGLLRTVTREVINEIALADAMPFMENRVPVMLPLLPENPVRAGFYDESDPARKRMELMISLPPHVRTLDFDQPLAEIAPRLSFPYTLFYFAMTTGAENPRGQDWSLVNQLVYFADKRINNLDQWIVPALLPNVYEDGSICYGNTGVDAVQPLSDRLDELVNSWYLTRFTNHHVREYEWPWHKKTYKRWAEETERDAACWKNFPEWDRANATVQHTQIRDVFTKDMARDVPIVLPDGIPPLNFTPTFGRAEEWVKDLDDNNKRVRLLVALQNQQAENPHLFTVDAPTITADDDEDDD